MPDEPQQALTAIRAFVAEQHALHEQRSKGGQHVGRSPSVSPSVLKDLDRMLALDGETVASGVGQRSLPETGRSAVEKAVDAAFHEMWSRLPLNKKAEFMQLGFSLDPILLAIRNCERSLPEAQLGQLRARITALQAEYLKESERLDGLRGSGYESQLFPETVLRVCAGGLAALLDPTP